MLDKEYIYRLPANIAKVYHNYEKNKTYQCLLDVFCQTIHFFGCTFLSEYLYRKESNPKINEKISGLFRPSLGTWYDFICAYYREFGRPNNTFITEFKSIFEYLLSKPNKGLASDYTGRFKNENAFPDNPFAEIIAMRNNIAHAPSSPTAEESAEIVKIYSKHMQVIFDALRPIFENYTVSKCVNVDDSDYDLETTTTAYFDYIHYEKPSNENDPVAFTGEDYHHFFKVNDMYLVYKGEGHSRAMRYAEYLLDLEQTSTDDKITEEKEIYFLFDGYGKKDVTYLGYRLKKKIEIYLDQVKTKFTEHGASAKWTANSFNLESFHEYVNELSKLSVNNHRNSRKYLREVYVERSCDQYIRNFIESDKTTLVVTAEAGVGKTNFLCYHTENLIKNGFTVYFYNGGSLIDSQHENLLFRRLEEECLEDELFHNVSEFLSYLNGKIQASSTIKTDHTQGFHFVMIIDAANEAYNVLNVLREIEDITKYGHRYPWLKLIVSIRSISFNILSNRITGEYGKKFFFQEDKNNYYPITADGIVNYHLEIPHWNILQIGEGIKKYCKSYNVKINQIDIYNLSPGVQKMFSNPLNLNLYFKTLKKNPTVAINNEEELFETINESLAENQEIVDRTHDLLYNIIKEMIVSRKNELESDKINTISENIKAKYRDNYQLYILSPYERLLDLGILYEKSVEYYRVTGFVFQKYLEFCIYKYIKAQHYDISILIGKILDTYSWYEMPEAFLAFITLLSKEHLSVSVLDKLLNTAQGRSIAPETLREALMHYISKLIAFLSKTQNYSELTYLCEVLETYHVIGWTTDISEKLSLKDKTQATIDIIEAVKSTDHSLTDREKEALDFTHALILQKISDYSGAEILFKKCAQSANESMRNNAIVQLAKTVRKGGNDKAAFTLLIDNLSKMDSNTPGYSGALIQIGLCKSSFGEIEEALQYYLKALEISERSMDYHEINYNKLGIGTAYRKLGNLSEAEKNYLDVQVETSRMGYLDLLPDSLNGLAYLSYEKGEYQNAIDYALKAVDIWSQSRYYVGIFNMYPVIIKAMAKLNRDHSEIQAYIDKADSMLSNGFVSEKIIIGNYYDALKSIQENQ